MDESTCMQKLVHAEIMSDIDNRRDYWRGYIRGLQRAYFGEAFGTDADHEWWSSMADEDNEQNQQRGLGYLDGLRAGSGRAGSWRTWAWMIQSTCRWCGEELPKKVGREPLCRKQAFKRAPVRG